MAKKDDTMLSNQSWRKLFVEWPADVPRRGIVIDRFGEATPFKGFMIREDTLLLDRTNPDSLGGRFVMLSFDTIASLKLVDPVKESAFKAMGFAGKLSQA